MLDSAIVFCEQGDAATFTDEYDHESQSVSFASGIPLAYAMTDGLRIDRKTINAIGKMGSLSNLFGCAGGVYGSSAGTLEGLGYPLGAVISISQGTILRRIASLHGGNNLPPETAFMSLADQPWAPCDGLETPMEFDAT